MALVAAVLLSLLYFRWPPRTLHLRRAALCGLSTSSAAILKSGAQSALRILFSCVSLLFLNYVVGNEVGVMGIALLTVCGNVQLLAVAFFNAGGQAAIPMEGVLYTERDYNGLRLLMRYVFRVVLACVAVLMLVVWLFPSQIVGLFAPGGIEGSDWLLRLYALGFLPLSVNYVLAYYYNAIGRRLVATVLTLCENLVFYLPLIVVLTATFGLIGAILSFVCTEALALAVVFGMAAHLRRAEQFDNLLLIPHVPREVVFEATAHAGDTCASRVARGMKEALDGCDVEGSAALRATVAVEEMIVNAAAVNQATKREVSIDVVVSAFPDNVLVSLRDNGVPFDPTAASEDVGERSPDASSVPEIDSVAALRAVASSLDYSYTLGMNHTIIEVERWEVQP